MRTRIRHIYACGDVNGMFSYAHVAGYEAGIAVSDALLRIPLKADYSKVPWCTHTDPEIASVGFNEKRARAGGVEYSVLAASFREVHRALAEGEPEGRIKVLIDRRGTVLGCQIAGSRAGELIHEWVAAVRGGVSTIALADAVHAYPTLARISKKALDEYDSARFSEDRTKRILRFLLGLRGNQ
jgi:pyruvate/2-oxoglutarate dehydrogenase complex dihydrolipoamide dehydrogenase (E3) component